MSSLNKSVIQEWHKYRNIVSHFSSVMGHINIKKPLKNRQKLSNASYASIFSFFAPDFVWSFQKRNWKANPKTLELKRNYLERNQAYKQNIEECKPLHLKVQNIKDYWKQNKYMQIYIHCRYMIDKEIVESFYK